MKLSLKIAMVFFLSVFIAFFALACESQEYLNNLQTEPSTAPSTAPSTPASDNPLIATELQRVPIYNGSGTDMLGFYAYIKIEKTTLAQITLEEYTEFCETVVDNMIYSWVSIICDDGTGIQFSGSQYTIATYGTITYEGIITQDFGYIQQTEDGFIYEECK